MKPRMKKLLSFLVAAAMVFGTMLPSYQTSAASAPKLSAVKKTIAVGNKAVLKVKNAPAGSRYTWTSSNKKVAAVTSKGTVTAVKTGKAVITCKVKTEKKVYTLKCGLTVTANTVVATQAKLNRALQNPKIKKITVKTSLEKKLTIPEGNYSKKDIVVDSPKAEIENSGIFKSVTIQSIKPGTWTERAKGNRITVMAKKARVVVAETAQVESLDLASDGANVAVWVEGNVKQVSVSRKASINMTVNGTVTQVTIEAAAQVEIAGETKTVAVTVTSSAKGAQISASVTVTVSANADVKLDLSKGAEGSTVTTTDESVNTTIHNETAEKVEVTTPAGTGTVEPGKEESSTDVTKPEPTPKPSADTSGGGGGGGTTTPSVVHPSGITLSQTTGMLAPGGKLNLTATVSPANANNKTVNWSSGDTSVAIVTNGTVTAVTPGIVTITAGTADGGKTASCKITVYANESELTSASSESYSSSSVTASSESYSSSVTASSESHEKSSESHEKSSVSHEKSDESYSSSSVTASSESYSSSVTASSESHEKSSESHEKSSVSHEKSDESYKSSVTASSESHETWSSMSSYSHSVSVSEAAVAIAAEGNKTEE